jgi:hypothetical protein
VTAELSDIVCFMMQSKGIGSELEVFYKAYARHLEHCNQVDAALRVLTSGIQRCETYTAMQHVTRCRAKLCIGVTAHVHLALASLPILYLLWDTDRICLLHVHRNGDGPELAGELEALKQRAARGQPVAGGAQPHEQAAEAARHAFLKMRRDNDPSGRCAKFKLLFSAHLPGYTFLGSPHF